MDNWLKQKIFHQVLHDSLSILIWKPRNPRRLVFICDEYRCVLELGISFMANCIKNALEMEA